MHQILGLDAGGHRYFERGARAPSLEACFRKPDEYLKTFKEEERVNLYVTVHDTKGTEARDWAGQEYLPFDIDGVKEDDAEAVARLSCEVLQVEYDKTGIIFSGHGVWLLVKIEKKIEEPKFFTENRILYKNICQKLNHAFKTGGYSCEADVSVFSSKRLMRMPGTINRKPEKGPDVWARAIQPHIEHQGFTLEGACGMPRLAERDSLSREFFKSKNAPIPDTKSVLRECDFLQWGGKNPNSVTEEQWFAAAGIFAWLEDGEKLFHDWSKNYDGYSPEETTFKINHVRQTTGPRKCESIDRIWDGCKGCKWWGRCNSPVQIEGPDFIRTKSTGFYHIHPETGKRSPAYEDLAKYYHKKEGEFFTAESEAFYRYSEKDLFWKRTPEIFLQSFAYNTMNPVPRSNICNEFAHTIKRIKVRDISWMQEASLRKMNFQNGVLDLDTMEFMEHGHRHGFMHVLPYAYDPKARAPRFEKFLKEITCGREDLAELLLEFMGYAISGDECWEHKCLILIGDGRNGKSTFNKVLQGLIGKEGYSSLSLSNLDDIQQRASLEGKLCNIGDENNPRALLNSEIFKTLVAGGEHVIKVVYEKPMTLKNKAKFIFNCNELPATSDKTDAFFRRLIFVPFDAIFDGKVVDKFIDAKLAAEYPGILNMCIAAYKRLRERGGLPLPECSREIAEQYRQAVDEFDDWFETCVEVQEDNDEPYSVVKDSYKAYCDRIHNRFPMHDIQFGRRLKKLGADRVRKNVDGRKQYFIKNIKIRSGF